MGRFQVIEYFSHFAIRDTMTGQEQAMSDGAVDLRHEARAKIYATPIEALNPAQPDLYHDDTIWPLFDRLRDSFAEAV